MDFWELLERAKKSRQSLALSLRKVHESKRLLLSEEAGSEKWNAAFEDAIYWARSAAQWRASHERWIEMAMKERIERRFVRKRT